MGVYMAEDYRDITDGTAGLGKVSLVCVKRKNTIVGAYHVGLYFTSLAMIF